jgi:hypothetical protein
VITGHDRLHHAHHADAIGAAADEQRHWKDVPRALNCKDNPLLIDDVAGAAQRVAAKQVVMECGDRLWDNVVDVCSQELLLVAHAPRSHYISVHGARHHHGDPRRECTNLMRVPKQAARLRICRQY